jgi:hypothetical protein
MPFRVFRCALKASAARYCGLLPRSRGFFPARFNPNCEWKKEPPMHEDDDKILRLTKEIIIKFIEIGRVSPSNFDAHFKSVFWTIKKTAIDAQCPDLNEVFSSTASGNPDES